MTAELTGSRLLRNALRSRLRLLLPAVLLMCIWQACEAAVPILIGLVIDRAVLPRSVPGLIIGLTALAVLFTVLTFGYRFGARLGNTAMHRQTHDLRVEVARHALRPRGVRSRLLPGEVLSVATADADVAGMVFRQVAMTGAALCGVLVGTGYLIITDWVVGVIVLVAVACSLALTHLLTPLIGRRTSAQQEQVASASGRATDLMQGLRVLKGIGGEEAGRQRYRTASRSARDATVATIGGTALVEALQTALLGLLVGAVVLGTGARLLAGQISIGELIAIVGLATFLAEPIGTLVMISSMVARSSAAARRIADYLNAGPLLTDGTRAADPDGDPVRLITAAGDREELVVRSGEQIAVVAADQPSVDVVLAALSGETGHSADAGDHDHPATAWIHGVPRTELTPESVRDHLLVVPHHVDLFEGTVAENIWLDAAPTATDTGARPPESDPGVRAVLEASAVSEMLALFPEGLQHPIDASGTNLSGGQRQRLALARALAADPPVLVLHDPTTSVDAVTEQQIARSVRTLRQGRTTIVITASPAFLDAADRVVLIGPDGIRSGRHTELLERDAGYRAQVGGRSG